jgi:Anti-sigma-28 factor, FlgM
MELTLDTPTREERLAELKGQIVMDDYTVDASLVADAILTKVRLVRAVRRQMLDDPGADQSLEGRSPNRPGAGSRPPYRVATGRFR